MKSLNFQMKSLNLSERPTDGSFVQQSRDAEDVAVADLRQGALDDALAALQAAVALEGVPRPLPLHPMEHLHLAEPGNQHQL